MNHNAGTITVNLSGATKDLDNALKGIEQRFSQFGMNLQQAGWRMGMSVTAPLTAALGFAIKKSLDFDMAMTGVAKVLDTTAGETKALSEQFRSMAEKIPLSAAELAKLAQTAGQLGITKDKVGGVVEVMAKLGIATEMGAEEATMFAAQFAKITGLGTESFSNIGSAVADTARKTAAFGKQIADMSLRLAGAGNQLGLSAGQIIGLAAGMKDLGIRTEMGASAMSRVLMLIAKAVSEGGPKLQAFANVAGLTADQFKEMVKNDPGQAIGRFVEGLGQVKDAGGNVFLQLDKLGMQNIRIADTFLRLGNAGQNLSRVINMGSDAFAKNTELNRQAEKYFAANANQLKMLWNQLTNVAMTLGDALVPVMIQFLQALKPLLNLVAAAVKWFATWPEWLRGTALGFAALLAAFGPASYLIGSLIQAIGSLAGAFRMLLPMMVAGFGRISTGLFSVRAAFAAAGVAGTGFRGVLVGLRPLLSSLIPVAVIIGLSMLIGKLGTAAAKAQEAGDQIAESAAKIRAGFAKLDEGGTLTRMMAENVRYETLKKQLSALTTEKTAMEDEKRRTGAKWAEGEIAHYRQLQEQIDYLLPRMTEANENVRALSDQYKQMYDASHQAKTPPVVPIVTEDEGITDKALRARKKFIDEQIRLGDALVSNEEQQLVQRITNIKNFMAEEEAAGRGAASKQQQIWLGLHEKLVAAEEDLDALRQHKVQDQIDLNSVLEKDEETRLAKKLELLKNAIAVEEKEGRGAASEHHALWLQLTTDRITTEDQLASVRKSKVNEAMQLERGWARFYVESGQITVAERIAQIDRELEALRLAGKAQSEQALELQQEKQEYLEKDEKAEERHLRRMQRLQERYQNNVTRFWENMATTMEDVLVDALTGTKVKWEEVFRQILKDLTRLVIRLLAIRALMAALNIATGGVSGAASVVGADLTGGFAGMAANGLNVGAGKSYLVGERGPELFVPGESGQVKPIVAGTSGVNFDFSSFPRARNTIESARDAQWQQFLRESMRVATAQGFK